MCHERINIRNKINLLDWYSSHECGGSVFPKWLYLEYQKFLLGKWELKGMGGGVLLNCTVLKKLICIHGLIGSVL